MNPIRNQLGAKAIVIRAEKSIIRLLFSFFSDLYLDDITAKMYKNSGTIHITIYFSSFKDRATFEEQYGDYLGAIIEFFNDYIFLGEGKLYPVNLKIIRKIL